MTFQEKTNWVALVVALPTLLVYAAVIVPQLLSKPLAEVSWVQPLLLAIVAFVVANVLGNVAIAVSNPREADASDERDQAIDRFGERFGNWLIVAGAIAGLVLAMAMTHQFWIANAIVLGFLAGSIVSALAKIAGYRGWVQRW
jgi:hypothetical protein